MSLSQARKRVHMEERALEGQNGVQETIRKRRTTVGSSSYKILSG